MTRSQGFIDDSPITLFKLARNLILKKLYGKTEIDLDDFDENHNGTDFGHAINKLKGLVDQFLSTRQSNTCLLIGKHRIGKSSV